MLTDRELQSLRNMGNEAEAAADEIAELRHAAAEHAAQADARIAALEAALRSADIGIGGTLANATKRQHCVEDMDAIQQMIRAALGPKA